MKRYICPNKQNFTIGITAGGIRQYVNFEPLLVGRQKIASLTTRDHQLQEALENHPYFNTVWFIDPLVKDAETEAQPQEELKTMIKEVRNFQQARKYLIASGHCTSAEVRDTKELLRIAAEKNIVFPMWQPKEAPTI